MKNVFLSYYRNIFYRNIVSKNIVCDVGLNKILWCRSYGILMTTIFLNFGSTEPQRTKAWTSRRIPTRIRIVSWSLMTSWNLNSIPTQYTMSHKYCHKLILRCQTVLWKKINKLYCLNKQVKLSQNHHFALKSKGFNICECIKRLI